jgi:Flp pilus assembly protein TadB
MTSATGMVAALVTFGLALGVGVRRGPPRRRRDRRRRHRAPRPTLGRWVALIAGGGIALSVLGPAAVVLLLLAAALARRAVAAQAAARAAADVRRAAPDVVDLFVVAASAGHPVARTLELVAPRAPDAVRGALVEADRRRRQGMRLDDCLAELSDELGEPLAALVDALRQSAATGVSLPPLLVEAASTARDARRRGAQEAARRLPVLMLLPLAGCVLPAAVLLAVVPVVLVSFASLSG